MNRLLLTLTLLSAATATATAHDCAKPRPTCGHKVVECKVLVPEWTCEKKTIKCTEYKREIKERKVKYREWVKHEETKTRDVTVTERVCKSKEVEHKVLRPVWKTVEREVTVNVPTWVTKKRMRPVCKTVWEDEEEEYTEMVPCIEKRKEKVCVWKCLPVTFTKKICVDEGKWEEKTVEICCNGKLVTCTQRCWVPNIVEKEIECTRHEWKQVEEERECEVEVCKPVKKTRTVKRCKQVWTEEECEYQVCVLKPEKKKCCQRVCEMVPEVCKRTVHYIKLVPKTIKKEYTTCRWECVEKEKTVKECVCVPHTVEKVVEVPVCRWVEKTVKCCACCDPCANPCCR